MNATNYIDLSKDKRNETLVGIVKARMICSFFSIAGCFSIMIIYLVLCIQVYLKKKRVTPQEEQINPKLESQNKISLGSHFMLFLILANFLSSFLPIIFYVYYEDYVSNVGDTLCTILGFCHNFLVLFNYLKLRHRSLSLLQVKKESISYLLLFVQSFSL